MRKARSRGVTDERRRSLLANLIEQVRAAMRAAGLSQAHLSEAAGASASTVSYVLCGHVDPRASTLLALLDEIGFTLHVAPSSPRPTMPVRTARPIGAGWWLIDGGVFGRDARRSLAELEAEHGPIQAGPQTHAAYDEHGQDRTVEEPVTTTELAEIFGCGEAAVGDRLAALAPWDRVAAAERARERRERPLRARGETPLRSVLTELQIAIERSGLAPEELAERAGVPVEAVHELLHGYADPSMTTAARLLRAIGGRLRVEAPR